MKNNQKKNEHKRGLFFSSLLVGLLFFSCQKKPGITDPLSTANPRAVTASAYYLNLLMDQLTYDSIQLDLQNSAEARSFIGSQVTAKANQALSQAPSPVSQISSGTVEAGVNAEADRIYSLGMQYFLFQGDASAQSYADKVKEYLLAWAAVNTPSNETPQESAYLGFMYGYSLIRPKIDNTSRTTIDNWFRNRYNYYKGRPVRNDNWESIRVSLMLSIAYILNDATLISQSTTAFNTHQNLSYRADGVSVDFIRRDAFAYHVYDMSFVGRSVRILCIYNGRSAAGNLAYRRSASWVTPRVTNPGPAVLGGSIADAIAFMKPYVVDPANNVHLEFVNTEWAPDKQRSDYNKPFSPNGCVYGLIELAPIFRDEVHRIFQVLDPSTNRFKHGIKYYINSFGVSAVNPNPEKAILYGNGGYGGWYKELAAGNYPLADLTAAGLPNDQLSSIIIPDGWKATLYADGNFSGSSVVITRNVGSLLESSYNFNDKMSSIKIETATGVQFYENGNYGGIASQFLAKGNYTLSQMQAKGVLNDWASSVAIPAGWKVTLYENDNFGGTSWVLTSNNSWLGGLSPSANDKTSSIKIE